MTQPDVTTEAPKKKAPLTTEQLLAMPRAAATTSVSVSFAGGTADLTERLLVGTTYGEVLAGPDGLPRVEGMPLDPVLANTLGQEATADFSKAAGVLLRRRGQIVDLANKYDAGVKALRTRVEKSAATALRKVPGGKEELAALTQMRHAAALNFLANPLNVASGAGKRRVEGQLELGLRVAGSAVAPLLPGEAEDEARARLASSLLDHTAPLAAVAGVDPAAFRRTVRPVPAPEGSVGLAVEYSIRTSTLRKFKTLVAALGSATDMPVVNAMVASRDILIANGAEDLEDEDTPEADALLNHEVREGLVEEEPEADPQEPVVIPAFHPNGQGASLI